MVSKNYIKDIYGNSKTILYDVIMEKWEYIYYKSSLLNEDDLLVRLNEVGEEGWELVQILKNTFIMTLIFKRKIQQVSNNLDSGDFRDNTSQFYDK